MATTFSFLVPHGEEEGEYPSLRRHAARSSRTSIVTLVCTASFSILVSGFVGIICFVRNEPGSREMEERYGPRECAAGPDLYSTAAVNYSPCCVHYASSCCELHDECTKHYQYPGWHCPADHGAIACGVLPRKPRPACVELMNLLSCARCSPYGGHFVTASPSLLNVTICATFCHQLWAACGEATTTQHGPLDFCASLGLHVAMAESSPSEPCFSSASHHGGTRLLPCITAALALRAVWARSV